MKVLEFSKLQKVVARIAILIAILVPAFWIHAIDVAADLWHVAMTFLGIENDPLKQFLAVAVPLALVVVCYAAAKYYEYYEQEWARTEPDSDVMSLLKQAAEINQRK